MKIMKKRVNGGPSTKKPMNHTTALNLIGDQAQVRDGGVVEGLMLLTQFQLTPQ
jgi:hypothetical protein